MKAKKPEPRAICKKKSGFVGCSHIDCPKRKIVSAKVPDGHGEIFGTGNYIHRPKDGN